VSRGVKKVHPHKVALGISHKQIFDSLLGKISDGSTDHAANGSEERGARLTGESAVRHPDNEVTLLATEHDPVGDFEARSRTGPPAKE
jgi:hypothetical protein